MNRRTVARMDWYPDCEGLDGVDNIRAVLNSIGLDRCYPPSNSPVVVCDTQHYHKLHFQQLYQGLRTGLSRGQWADSDNPSGSPPSGEYDKALACYVAFYSFDNNEPFYHRVLTNQYGKRSRRAYTAIALYLERKG